jgi:hypothetical protein
MWGKTGTRKSPFYRYLPLQLGLLTKEHFTHLAISLKNVTNTVR